MATADGDVEVFTFFEAAVDGWTGQGEVGSGVCEWKYCDSRYSDVMEE